MGNKVLRNNSLREINSNAKQIKKCVVGILTINEYKIFQNELDLLENKNIETTQSEASKVIYNLY
jgi:hypothetical protein